MAMTSKDYEGIAAILKKLRKDHALTNRESQLLACVVLDIASFMQARNTSFSRQRFLEAAGQPNFD